MTLVVQVPTGLSEEAKDALRHFDEVSVQSLKNQNGAAAMGKHGKKKGFMDRLKETFEDKEQ